MFFFKWSPDYWPILLGLVFVAVVLYLPNGLIEFVEKFRKKFRSLTLANHSSEK